VIDLPFAVPADISLPKGAALRLVDAAAREWGTPSVREVAPGVTRVLFWLGGKWQPTRRTVSPPVGGFLIRWHYPSVAQATIERLGWDPKNGGCEAEVRQVIDVLVGWPVAGSAVRRYSGAA
jgi:hypothetical protein